MGLKLYEETSVQAIANAIRAKNGSSDTYNISEMSTAIANIPSGGIIEEVDYTVRMTGPISSSGEASAYNSLNSNYKGWQAFYTKYSFNAARSSEYWAGKGDGAYLQFRFATQRTITKVAYASYTYSKFKIMYSADGINYSEADTFEQDQSGNQPVAFEYTLTNPITCIYIRFVCDGAAYNLGAVHIYGVEEHKPQFYKYHWYGRICVREGVGETIWFFDGLEVNALDTTVPLDLLEFMPIDKQPIYADSYTTSAATTQAGYIGFYNGSIRSWNTSMGGAYVGPVYGYVRVYKEQTGEQHNGGYVNPTDVPVSDTTLISETITENGTYSAEDDGYVGYSDVTVNVPTVEGVIIGRTGDDRIVLPYTDSNDDYEYVLKFYNSSYQHNVSILGNSANGYNIQLTEYSNAWYCDGGNNDQLSYTPASTDDFVGHFIFVSNAIDGTMGLSDRDIALFDEGGILLHKFGTKGTSVLATPDIWLLSRSGTGEATNGVIERFTVKDKSNNNAIVCDYIPAMVAVDGIKYSGLLNTVNNTFIHNSYKSIIGGVAF